MAVQSIDRDGNLRMMQLWSIRLGTLTVQSWVQPFGRARVLGSPLCLEFLQPIEHQMQDGCEELQANWSWSWIHLVWDSMSSFAPVPDDVLLSTV